jgi:hypothetical protein
MNRSMPRLYLICPNTGSMVILRWALGRVGGKVDALVLVKPRQRADQAIGSITRDRPGLAGAMGFQLAARDPKPLPPATAPQHRPRQHGGLEIQRHLHRRVSLDPASFALC